MAVKKRHRLSVKAVMSFFCSLALCSFVAGITISSRQNIEKLQVEQLILEKTIRINDVISKLLYRANSLATMVVQGNGVVENFDIVAPTIANDPAILNVLVAPGGVVSNVYPLTDGNDAVLGWDFFSNNPGNLEAIAAMDSGTILLGGPFRSAQGSEVLVGRMPVYIDTPLEKNKLWGLVSVTLRFPDALDNADLGILSSRGLAYELWRINPDTNERQVIATNYEFARTDAHFTEKHVPVINANWYLKVWLTYAWYNHPENLALIIAGFLISLLVFFVMQNNYELKKMRTVLEDIVKTDPLTGIFNRRHFMEISYMNTERERRQNGECYIVLFDLDRFKKINDTYGHVVGDYVLIEVSSRVKAMIRPYDLFARYGGEEFIIYASQADKKDIFEMTERIRLALFNNEFKNNEVSFSVSASFGIACINDYDIGKAIVNADKALYKAKENGRNNTVFWDVNY
ncbi:MAG: sensor domain-containing diguanylate cyclase [Treponema sp.]|nr:sensor domain-containing diguanylate cyclase [Treponema sp.]